MLRGMLVIMLADELQMLIVAADHWCSSVSIAVCHCNDDRYIVSCGTVSIAVGHCNDDRYIICCGSVRVLLMIAVWRCW